MRNRSCLLIDGRAFHIERPDPRAKHVLKTETWKSNMTDHGKEGLNETATHDWLHDVLIDLRNYAAKMHLFEVQDAIERSRMALSKETGRKLEKGTVPSNKMGADKITVVQFPK